MVRWLARLLLVNKQTLTAEKHEIASACIPALPVAVLSATVIAQPQTGSGPRNKAGNGMKVRGLTK